MVPCRPRTESPRVSVETVAPPHLQIIWTIREVSTTTGGPTVGGTARTRKLFTTAVLDEVHVRDGRVVEATDMERFHLLFCVPTVKWDDVVEVGRHDKNHSPVLVIPRST